MDVCCTAVSTVKPGGQPWSPSLTARGRGSAAYSRVPEGRSVATCILSTLLTSVVISFWRGVRMGCESVTCHVVGATNLVESVSGVQVR
jgi:hypothetical protein